MKKNYIFRCFVLLLVCVPWAVIASVTIPTPIIDRLKKVYDDPSFQETKDTFSLVKLIHVLCNNDVHLKSLASVLDEEVLFAQMVRHIILFEMEKKKKEFWGNIYDRGMEISKTCMEITKTYLPYVPWIVGGTWGISKLPETTRSICNFVKSFFSK